MIRTFWSPAELDQGIQADGFYLQKLEMDKNMLSCVFKVYDKRNS